MIVVFRIFCLLMTALVFQGSVFGQQKAEPVIRFKTHEAVTYKQVGTQKLLLDAYIPAEGDKNPAVLILFGGAWKRGNRKQLKGYATELAGRGFACFAIDYRLAPKHKFPAQIEDCRSAVGWIRKHAKEYRVDPDRLGAVGYSSGGHLATLLGTTGEPPTKENGNVDTRVQVVVAGGAPTDFRWMPDKGNWAKYWMGGNLDQVPEKFQAASSAAFVDKDDPPMFFFHGVEDAIVPIIWADMCRLALKNAGVETQMHRIPDAGHIEASSNKPALKKAFEFLEKKIGEKPAIDKPKQTPETPAQQ